MTEKKRLEAIHPARVHIHVPAGMGQRITDSITTFVGSLWCIYLHALWFVLWFVFRLDINLLTLIVSLEAIFLSTLVMISQNRQSEKDRKRDDTEAAEVQEIYQINKQQLEILQEQEYLKKMTELILRSIEHSRSRLIRKGVKEAKAPQVPGNGITQEVAIILAPKEKSA